MTDVPTPEPINDKAALYRKMSAVMGAISRIPKDGKNTQQNYKYATSDDVADAIRVAMAEQRLALFVEMLDVTQEQVSGKTATGTRTHAKFKFMFACGDTGATHSCLWEAQADDYGDKGMNKVATVAEKYFLMKTFVMSAGDEKDPDSEPGIERSASKSAPRTPSAPQQQPTMPPKWVTADNVAKVISAIKQQIPGITDGQIVEYAHISSLMDVTGPYGWGIYESGKLAADTVITNWKNSKPATPKSAKPTFGIVNETLFDTFNRQPEDAFKALNIKGWDAYETPELAWEAALAVGIKEHWPMVADEVTYVEKGAQKYLEFHTRVKVRAYGRSTTFKTAVGGWYDENNVGDYKPNEVYQIDAALISWEPKMGDDGKIKYLNFTGLTPLIKEEDAPPEGEDAESILDQYFS